MEKIVWEKLWTSEWRRFKGYIFFLNSTLNKSWIKRLKNEILLKNIRFIEMLSILNEKIIHVSTDIEWSWYKVQNMFLIEDEDFISYLKSNIDKIRSWDLLIWFLYNWIVIKSIVFWTQIVENSVIDKNIKSFSERVYSLFSNNFDI